MSTISSAKLLPRRRARVALFIHETCEGLQAQDAGEVVLVGARLQPFVHVLDIVGQGAGQQRHQQHRHALGQQRQAIGQRQHVMAFDEMAE